jgi:hypothetical protein
MLRRIFPLAILILITITAAHGQTTDPFKFSDLTDSEKALLKEIMAARANMSGCGYVPDSEPCQKTNYEQLYREAIKKAVDYPNVLLAIATSAIQSYDALRLQTKSAPQASQIADQQNAELMRVIILQNQKIIQLLDQLVKKK